jgi:hypothetical protein
MLIKAEPKTAYQISTGMTWMSDTSGQSWQNLSPRNKRLAITETIAHLESMRIGDKIEKFPKNSIVYYKQN